jgi:hypothetical protein
MLFFCQQRHVILLSTEACYSFCQQRHVILLSTEACYVFVNRGMLFFCQQRHDIPAQHHRSIGVCACACMCACVGACVYVCVRVLPAVRACAASCMENQTPIIRSCACQISSGLQALCTRSASFTDHLHSLLLRTDPTIITRIPHIIQIPPSSHGYHTSRRSHHHHMNFTHHTDPTTITRSHLSFRSHYHHTDLTRHADPTIITRIPHVNQIPATSHRSHRSYRSHHHHTNPTRHTDPTIITGYTNFGGNASGRFRRAHRLQQRKSH